MEQPMSLPVADAQLHQAMNDYREAYERATSEDAINAKMAFCNMLRSLRSLEASGMTDGGRKHLRNCIETCRTMLGAT